uniref:Uncharacterized protein n=1 Tax=Trichobilharzia regenti TaxID=157069 RepID=A0AA85JPG0_TRIRE|nr:unnamed protein product [Trichobilharzia regenti]
MTALLLCRLSECKPAGSHENCNIQREYEKCVAEAKDDIHNLIPDFDVSSLKNGVNSDNNGFEKECLKHKACSTKIFLCFFGELVKPEWADCLSQKKLQVIKKAYENLKSEQNTPMELDLGTF